MAKQRTKKKRSKGPDVGKTPASKKWAGKHYVRLTHLYRKADVCERCGARAKNPCYVTDHTKFARRSIKAVFHAGRPMLERADAN